MAWQFDRLETGEGIVQAFRRGKNKELELAAPLRGLNPTGRYRVTNLDAQEFNGTVFLKREIGRAAAEATTHQRVILPASRTGRGGAGGIELSIARVADDPLVLASPVFRAISVVRGHGCLSLAGEQIEIGPHDHFGIPAGLQATLKGSGASSREPFVFLDAILQADPSEDAKTLEEHQSLFDRLLPNLPKREP
jgi:hypothetical protein